MRVPLSLLLGEPLAVAQTLMLSVGEAEGAALPVGVEQEEAVRGAVPVPQAPVPVAPPEPLAEPVPPTDAEPVPLPVAPLLPVLLMVAR